MNLNVERILIIGLGMIGASIALASRSKGIKVTGYDIDSNSVKNAFQNQIIDDEASSIEQINSKKYTKDTTAKDDLRHSTNCYKTHEQMY